MSSNVPPKIPSQSLKLATTFQPKGDQPNAISAITAAINAGAHNTLLEGVTGSGKTFTMAHVIQNLQRPTLILAPNKILAAQLYQEMIEFFPDNAVEYFVSYYDYYIPESYIATQNLYIAKESSINDYLDRLRNSATRSLLERNDTIIIASISCIYGIGRKEDYHSLALKLSVGEHLNQKQLSSHLVEMSYKRNNFAFLRGNFRIRGRYIEVFPSHLEKEAWRITYTGNTISAIHTFNPISGDTLEAIPNLILYPNTHYAASMTTVQKALEHMRHDLEIECKEFLEKGKIIEAERLRERTEYDMEMLDQTGSCHGIENYSRYFTQRAIGEPPPTLLEYFPKNSLLIVDESHMAIPQIKGMFLGDQARKRSLVDYGFRLKVCRDNRPLTFEEWDDIRPQTLLVSATPGEWELTHSTHHARQIIRPTGLLDPTCHLRTSNGQVYDLMAECRKRKALNERVLVTTLTQKSAELLTEFLVEHGIPSRYMHAKVDTLERTIIVQDFREGIFDVLVGINLLREGLDLPECSLVAILDADKAGYLRSKTALIQTIGRAARHANGTCILYVDQVCLSSQPQSLRDAIAEVQQRRTIQANYNATHNITPQSIIKPVHKNLCAPEKNPHTHIGRLSFKELVEYIKSLEASIEEAVANTDYNHAHELQKNLKRAQNALLKR